MPYFNTEKKSLTARDVFGVDNLRSRNSNLRCPSTAELLKQYTKTVFGVAERTANKVIDTQLRLYRKSKNGIKGKKLIGWQKKDLQARAKNYISGGDDVEEILSHPVLSLLAKPNPWLTKREMAKYGQLYKDISGLAYYKVVAGAGGIVEWDILPPPSVKVQRNKDGEISYYEWGKERLSPDEVIVQSGENLFDPYNDEGSNSPVKALFEDLAIQEKVTNTLYAILKNEGRPSGILTPKGEFNDLSQEDADRWRNKFRMFMAQGSGETLVLDSDATFTPLSYKPTDLAVIQIAEFIEESVCKAFGLPVMIYQGVEGGSRAAYETALQEWADGGISSRLRENEDFLNSKLLPLFADSENLFFCYDDPSPELEELTIQNAEGYLRLGATYNEARAMIGLEPRPGLDYGPADSGAKVDEAEAEPVESGDQDQPELEAPQEIQTLPSQTLNGSQIASATAIVASVAQGQLPRDSGLGQLQILLNLSAEQANLIMGSVGLTFFAASPSQPEAPGSARAGDDEEDDEPTEAEPEAPAKGLLLAANGAGMDASPAKLILPPGYEAKAAKPPAGKELAEILAEHFRKWEGHVIRSFEKSLSNIETKGLPARFIPVEEWEKDLAEQSQPVLEMYFQDEGKAAIARVGASDKVFSVFNPKVKRYAETAALNLAQSTLDTTSKDINSALEATRAAMGEGLEAGESIRQLTQRIKDIFESAETHRAKLIASTESARAFNEGHREGAASVNEALGKPVVKGFRHLTTSDPCPICQDLDGHLYGLDDALPPSNTHPGCLCVLTDELAELDD